MLLFCTTLTIHLKVVERLVKFVVAIRLLNIGQIFVVDRVAILLVTQRREL